MEIEKINADILRELFIDGRSEFAIIAKKLNVTKGTVLSRYKAMKKAGIIVGTTAQINYRTCGYGIYTTFSIEMNPKRRDIAIKSILELPGIYLAFKGPQSYLLHVGISIKNLAEIEKMKNKLASITFADRITPEIWLDVKNIPENLVLSGKNQIHSLDEKIAYNKHKFNINKFKLDKIDHEIIDLLSINGRMSFRQISKKVAKSHDTITNRYKKLVKNNIIKVVIQINPTKIGFQGWMIIDLSFSPKASLSKKINELLLIPNIIHLVKIEGLFDISIMVFVKDLDHLFKVQEKISKIEDLSKINIQNLRIPEIWPFSKQHMSTF